MSSEYPISEADESIALSAIGWIVSDSVRADRMLSLTGLDPEGLRASLNEPGALASLMDFIINHEPDLLACAESLGVTPGRLLEARSRLGGGRTA